MINLLYKLFDDDQEKKDLEEENLRLKKQISYMNNKVETYSFTFNVFLVMMLSFLGWFYWWWNY